MNFGPRLSGPSPPLRLIRRNDFLGHLSLRDIPAHRVRLAAQDFTRKENSHEQWWQRALGWRRRLGIRQHALDHFVVEHSSFDFVDDRSRYLQLVLCRVLRVDEVIIARLK